MECYNRNCNERETCDKYKMAACIYRRNKEQQDLIDEIKNYKYCEICGGITIKAKYGDRNIDLCVKCGVRGNLHENKQKAI